MSNGNLPSVLIVDDDEAVRRALEQALSLEGFVVHVASSGEAALEVAAEHAPDIVVIDMTMPGLDGTGVIRHWRSKGKEWPICVLSARSDVEDRVEGLQAGADDYLVKPFAMIELVARLRSLLRRAPVESTSVDVISVGDLSIDTGSRTVTRAGEALDLTKREFDLLEVLAVNREIVMDRSRLLDLVWGYDFDVETNVVDVFVGYLRKKTEFDSHPRLIHTVRGVGFVLKAES